MTADDPARVRHEGARLLARRRFAEARAHYTDACWRFGDDPELLFNLGVAHAELGAFDEAARLFALVVGRLPDMPIAHANLGRAREALGDLPGALDSYREAVRLAPDNVPLLHALGDACRKAGDAAGALGVYRALSRLSPADASVWSRFGHIQFDLGLLERAAASYRKALQLQPQSAEARADLGRVLIQLNALPEAERQFREALEIDPQLEHAIAGLADIARSRGDNQVAAELLGRCLAQGPASTPVLVSYARIAPSTGETAQAIALLDRQLAAQGQQPDRALHFALGALHDREGSFDRAFRHFREGNRLKQARFAPEVFAAEVSALIDFFTPESVAALPRSTVADQRPVFIVGMLRSGSTLVEQILSSHPQVAGAGELNDISNLVTRLKTQAGGYPARLAQLDSRGCDEMAQHYLNHLQDIDAGADRVLDKALTNFLHLGLIAMLFPGARVIHCTRDPLDTCLSCYFHDFVGTHHYSYDLVTLGLFYRQYQRLMAHWCSVLSLPVMQVSYESLVADALTQSRALVAFCGLEWDDQCSRFHENRRSVVTSSASQVREPIYNRSVKRHRHYEKHLAPLREALQMPGDERR